MTQSGTTRSSMIRIEKTDPEFKKHRDHLAKECGTLMVGDMYKSRGEKVPIIDLLTL